MHGKQSLAQKSTSTTLPIRSFVEGGVATLIQPAASSGGSGRPRYALTGFGLRPCSAIRIAAAAINSTKSDQNDRPESVGGDAESSGCESVVTRSEFEVRKRKPGSLLFAR